MNTENEQDSGEETQIYLLNDGRNFEHDAMKRTTENNSI